MGNRVHCDRLSNLPLSIIHEILARAPIIDAIKAIVLSNEWRYTWTSLPQLDSNHNIFYTEEIEDNGLLKEFTESIENFVSNVLLHHKGPIQSFELCIMLNINNDIIEKWMLCLSRKDIRELSLQLDRDEIDYMFVVKNLKSSLSSCAKLTKLELGTLTFHPPPTYFKGFLALTTLDLYDTELSSDEIESFIECCPLLVTLTMFDCSCEELRIRSPNLKNLLLHGDKHEKLCLYSPLLAIMDVGLPFLNKTLAHNYINFLGCLLISWS